MAIGTRKERGKPGKKKTRTGGNFHARKRQQQEKKRRGTSQPWGGQKGRGVSPWVGKVPALKEKLGGAKNHRARAVERRGEKLSGLDGAQNLQKGGKGEGLGRPPGDHNVGGEKRVQLRKKKKNPPFSIQGGGRYLPEKDQL